MDEEREVRNNYEDEIMLLEEKNLADLIEREPVLEVEQMNRRAVTFSDLP
jgi:hypothetical protein